MESINEPPSNPTIDADEARRMLESADDLQAAARREINAHSWQWFLVWAVVCLGAAVSAFTPIAGWFWIVGVPVGIGGTIAISARQHERSGVQRYPGGYWLIGGAMTVINFGASALLSDEVIVVVIWVVFGLGFTGFAMLERQPGAAVIFACLALATGIAGALVPDTFDLYVVAGIVFALAMVVVAVRIRSLGTPA
jgi:hypothetical protein